jgi:hypothetical protein
MHIDTDESNAACASGEVYGEIVRFGGECCEGECGK